MHTNAASVEKRFAKMPAAVMALEAGTHSGWMARVLKAKLGRPFRLQKSGRPPKEESDRSMEEACAKSKEGEWRECQVAKASAPWAGQQSDKNSEMR